MIFRFFGNYNTYSNQSYLDYSRMNFNCIYFNNIFINKVTVYFHHVSTNTCKSVYG